MSTAVLAGQPFRLNPTAISWDFSIGVSEHKTIGGKVIQVFGAKMGDLVIEGAFGIGGWQEQRAFLDHIILLGQEQLDHWPTVNRDPFRFIWAERGWDFQVWIKGYSEGAGGPSIDGSIENFNPKWRLTLFIVEDNAGLKEVSEESYIERLASGIGWKRTVFNGPASIEELQAVLSSAGVSTIREYLSVGYGLTSPFDGSAGGNSGAGTNPSTSTPGQIGMQTIQTLVPIARTAGWIDEAVAIAVAIAMAESGGDPNAHNTNAGTGDNSYGLWQINMLGSMGPARRQQFGLSSNDELFNPATNARVAYEMSGGGGNWSPWSTWKNGAYRQYLGAARQAAGG
jgi:hypothetical protein